MNPKARIGLFVVASTLLFFSQSYSQKNYISGTVIRISGDTLKGFIDFRDWSTNPNKINFKQTEESNTITLTPMEVRQFMVKGELYIGTIVETENSPTATNKLQQDAQPIVKIDTTFLQALVVGKKSLYFYNAKGKHNFYIDKGEDGFELLIYKKYLNQQNAIVENRKFLNQLGLYLNDCSNLFAQQNNLLYKKSALIDFFEKYYGCTSSEISFKRQRVKPRIEIGVLVGASLTYLDFNVNTPSPLVNSAFYKEATEKPSTNFSGGIFFDIIFPKNQGKWSLYNELLYSEYKVKTTKDGSFEFDYFRYSAGCNCNVAVYYLAESTIEVNYSFVKMNNTLRYKYPLGNINFYANAGISNAYVQQTVNRYDIKRVSNGRITRNIAFDNTLQYELGAVVGAGLKYKKFSFEGRYEYGFDVQIIRLRNSQIIYYNPQTSRVYVLMGYRFK